MSPISLIRIKTGICLFLLILAQSSCRHREVQLSMVRHLPGYFQNHGLFGEDPKQMEEKNQFILATGVIDTTDEVHPSRVAYICIGKKNIELKQVSSKQTGVSWDDEYVFENYHLTLTMPDGKLTVSDGRYRSEYRVFYKRGYF